MVEAAPDATIATRERILNGAREAIALHGVAKLGMADICATSGMSRGTLYRYFGSREELLLELSRREAERFRDEVLAAAREADTPEEQLRLLLEQVTQEVQKNRALQRLLESDPARVLAAIRAQFTTIRGQLREILGGALEALAPVESGLVDADHLADWVTRLLLTYYLVPDSEPERMRSGLAAMHRMLAGFDASGEGESSSPVEGAQGASLLSDSGGDA